jgi:amino acid transporter
VGHVPPRRYRGDAARLRLREAGSAVPVVGGTHHLPRRAISICVTLPPIDTSLLAFSGYPSASKILASVALTFFAYLGFNVITFTDGDLRDPRRNIPHATYGAIGITAVTYVLIAIGVFGTFTVPEVIR